MGDNDREGQSWMEAYSVHPELSFQNLLGCISDLKAHYSIFITGRDGIAASLDYFLA